jgi:hypothetical protein
MKKIGAYISPHNMGFISLGVVIHACPHVLHAPLAAWKSTFTLSLLCSYVPHLLPHGYFQCLHNQPCVIEQEAVLIALPVFQKQGMSI